MEHFMHMEKIRVDATPKAFSTESSVVIVAARPIRWSAKRRFRRLLCSMTSILAVLTSLPGRADDRIDLKSLPLKEREVLTSLVVHSDWIFASTLQGPYRASTHNKKWIRIPTPERMRSIGCFAVQPADSTVVYFNAPNAPSWRPIGADREKTFGLYRFDLRNEKWEPLSEREDLGDTFVNSQGVIYALAMTGGGHLDSKPRVVTSTDSGRHWADITGGISDHILGISPDPDSNDMPCVCGGISAIFIYQASDRKFAWRRIPLREWTDKHSSGEEIFQREYDTQSALFYYHATLSNYFSFPFGQRTEVPSFQIAVEGPRTFKRADRIVLPVSVSFLCDGETATVVDTDSAPLVWGLNRILPDGSKEIISVATPDPPTRGPRKVYENKLTLVVPAVVGKRPESGTLRVHHLKHGESFRRSLDLTALCDFPATGTYRLQVIYEDTFIADQKKGEWSGRFCSPVFEIKIVK